MKEFLSQKGIAFTEIDVIALAGGEKDEAIRIMRKKTGQPFTPAVLVDGKLVAVGFDRAKLEAALA